MADHQPVKTEAEFAPEPVSLVNDTDDVEESTIETGLLDHIPAFVEQPLVPTVAEHVQPYINNHQQQQLVLDPQLLQGILGCGNLWIRDEIRSQLGQLREDLKIQLRGEMKAQMQQLREDMKKQFYKDMKVQVQQLRNDLQPQIRELRNDLRLHNQELRSDMQSSVRQVRYDTDSYLSHIEFNEDSRRRNAYVDSNTKYIFHLIDPRSGARFVGFPETIRGLEGLKDAMLDSLLKAMKITVSGERANKERVWKRFVGIRAE